MSSYLLLRNNREKGPFSLEELIQHGLKPYDLIWVNGKSAAWRYPGEIAELKEYSPAVEEQPFDRFFKKPSGEKKQESLPVQPKEVIAQQPAYIPKKSVFVTLPGQKQQPARIKEPSVTGYEKYQPPVKETIIAETATPTISITETPVIPEIKYSQPLDEIKEMYVKTLQERKQKIAKKIFLHAAMKNAAVALAIVGVGILIGFAMKSNGNQPTAHAETVIPPQAITLPADTAEPVLQEQPAEEQKNEEMPVEPEYDETKPATREEIKEPGTKLQRQSPEQTPAVTTEKAIAVLPKKEVVQPEKKFVPEDEPSPGVEVNARTGERTKKVRSETTDEQPESKTISEPAPKAVLKNNSLSKQVSVSSNDYQKVAFGGIRNLQLTVSNDSKYVLDNVVVELQYLKPSEQPLKTESIQFRSVAPGGSQTIRVPDTNRGIKVTYKITHILSVQSAKDMADL